MNCVFEHVVDEIWVGLDKFVEHLELFDLTTLFVVEEVEVNLKAVKVHVFQ